MVGAIIKVITIYQVGMNMYTTFHGNLSNCFLDISV